MLGVALRAPLCVGRSCPLIDIVTTCGDSCELLTLASSSCQVLRPALWPRNARESALCRSQAPQKAMQLPVRQCKLSGSRPTIESQPDCRPRFRDFPGSKGCLVMQAPSAFKQPRDLGSPSLAACSSTARLRFSFFPTQAPFTAPVRNDSSPRKSETSTASASAASARLCLTTFIARRQLCSKPLHSKCACAR